MTLLNEGAHESLSYGPYRELDSYLIPDKDMGAEIESHIILSSRFSGKLVPLTDIFDILNQCHDLS